LWWILLIRLIKQSIILMKRLMKRNL
jgi:hypothetical protein